MSLIDKNNIYIAKNLIKADIKPDLMLTVMQLKTDKDIDPRATSSSTSCNSCSSLYQIEKIIHIFEDRVYKFTYYNEGIHYDKMIGEVTHIEYDANYPDSGYVEVKAYINEADVERKVYANIKRIPIANIQDAIDITPYESPIDKGDDYELMILGISAQKVRALIINLKMINDDELDQGIKEVSLIVGNTYKICYNNKDNELDCFEGTLTGMLEVPNLNQEFSTGYNPNLGFVREDSKCKYPEYNKYYLGKGCCCDGCPIAGNCHTEEEISFYNNTYDKDRFLKLPENMISDVLLTFDVTTGEDTETVYKKIYLSQIRDACDKYHYEDPASTDLEVDVNESTIYAYAKNARFVAVKYGEYGSWEYADIKPTDIYSLYPNSYYPILIQPSPMNPSNQYSILTEFVDNTRTIKTVTAEPSIPSMQNSVVNFVERFNSWVATHLCFNDDYTKPLIKAYTTIDNNDEHYIIFNVNYYDPFTITKIGQIINLLDPNVIDDFIINVIMKSFNTLDIYISQEEYKIVEYDDTDSKHYEGDYETYDFATLYENGALRPTRLYKFFRSILSRIFQDYHNKFHPTEESRSGIISALPESLLENELFYVLNEANDTFRISNKYGFSNRDYKIIYGVTFNSEEDLYECDERIDMFCAIFGKINMSDGKLINFTKYENDNVLFFEIYMLNALYSYLENIDQDIKNALNKFNIGEFVEIFNNIDVLEGYSPPIIKSYNNILSLVQKFNIFNNFILSGIKDTYLYKNDNSKVQIIDSDKTYYMQPIDENYQDHDPKGSYKLFSAFKNVFTDILNNTNFDKFDYPNGDDFAKNYKVFNMTATWQIGHLDPIEIPFSIIVPMSFD